MHKLLFDFLLQCRRYFTFFFLTRCPNTTLDMWLIPTRGFKPVAGLKEFAPKRDRTWDLLLNRSSIHRNPVIDKPLSQLVWLCGFAYFLFHRIFSFFFLTRCVTSSFHHMALIIRNLQYCYGFSVGCDPVIIHNFMIVDNHLCLSKLRCDSYWPLFISCIFYFLLCVFNCNSCFKNMICKLVLIHWNPNDLEYIMPLNHF